MTAALLYKPAQRWRIWMAIGAAALLHVGAVALAELRSKTLPLAVTEDNADAPVVGIDPPETEPPVPAEEIPTPPPPPSADESYVEETPTPPPVRRVASQAVKPLVRQAVAGQTRATTATSAKILALSAPRPEYPYEARRQRLTGSGVATLSIDTASGAVLEVTMLHSTGSPVLDSAAISGFRRWRFRAGTVAKVQTPITFTLTGAAY